MSGSLHDALRQGRVLLRNIRHSRLVAGAEHEKKKYAALEEVYAATNRFLYNLGVEYWLVYGTLLGYYRNGGLIKGDRDIDFGASEKEYETIREARAELPDGFRMFDTSHKHGGPKLYVVSSTGWEADIYFYRDRDGQLQVYENSPNTGDTMPFPREYVYPLKAATFLGKPTNVPNDAEAYLRHTYRYLGEDGVRDPKTGYWHPPATP